MTIEELREQLLRTDIQQHYLGDGSGRSDGFTEQRHIPTAEEIDSLIAAARAEGAEAERERIGVEGHLLRDCNSVLQIGGCSVLPTEEVSGIYERGVEEERERIRQEAIEHGCWSWQEEGGKMIQTVEIRADIIVPASVLAPVPKEEGK